MSTPFKFPPNRMVTLVDDEKKVTYNWFNSFSRLGLLLGRGFTGTITTAKLTGGGTNGSMTFTNGVLTDHLDAT